MVKLSIIIVSFNTRELTSNSLVSLQKAVKNLNYQTEIIVIDNASTDGSPELIAQKFTHVTLIKNSSNIGFSGANNQGLKIAKGEFILLLNSDTVVSKDAIKKVIGYLENNPESGVVGCKLLNKNGSLQQSAGFIPNLLNIFFWMTFIDDLPFLNRLLKPYHIRERGFYEKIQKVGWVSGAFFALRKKTYENAGSLDENIFMYGEEVEWCMRIGKSGWRVVYYPDAYITHLKGGSGNRSVSGLREEFTSLIYIFQKHKPSWQLPILITFLRLGALLRLFLFGIILWDKDRFKIYAQAFTLAG